jgi:hypothetical protein
MTFAEQLKEDYKQEFMDTFAQQLEQKGRKEEDLVIAKRMLARGTDRNFIKDVIGLSDQDLLNLED